MASTVFYLVHDQSGRWLSEKEERSSNTGNKYFWTKNRQFAATLRYDQAQKAGVRYGGVVRKCAVLSRPMRAFLEQDLGAR